LEGTFQTSLLRAYQALKALPSDVGPGICSLLAAHRALQAVTSHGVLGWWASKEAQEEAISSFAWGEGGWPCREQRVSVSILQSVPLQSPSDLVSVSEM
jgi:hypothetical protein